MSNPPDLVNVALEKLIEQRYELPAFSTLSRLVSHIRHQVHIELYESFNASLSDEQQQILDQLLEVAEGDRITDFSRINEIPRKPTLKLIRDWTTRLAWLQDILDTSKLFEIINPTKVHQFAAEVRNVEAQDLKDMKSPKRYTHLVCLIQQQQLLAKDQLVELFLRRMQRTRIGAEKRLETLIGQIYRNNRSAVLNLVELLGVQSGSQDHSLTDALDFVLTHRDSRVKHLPYDIGLDFMTSRWLNYVETKEAGTVVLNRRELEIAVIFHVADGLRYGDLYVPDSEQYADYRKQLLPWEECEKLLKSYCQGVGIPDNAKDFVAFLKKQLTDAATTADEAYPENTQFFIDQKGEPHLKKQKASALPKELAHFEELIKMKMPQWDLPDVLKRVHSWIPYTRHFDPPSGTTTKLKDPVYKYLFTIFGYGSNMGANQMARHIQGPLSSRVLRRINKQHVDSQKIDAAIRDIINNYNRWDLPEFWGDGSEMIVDGTHIELIENNMLGSQHIRYGSYGGIAYKYLSDKYIALFTRFISCGSWEAIHILDGFEANKSVLQPDTVIGDTHNQNEPVFALSYLMGIHLMPRMRNWDDVHFYRPEKGTNYEHIDSLFKKVADFDRIEKHWKDIMQVTLSIHAGKVLPSMLLRRLGVKGKKNNLYRAVRALGQVVRTIFLLKYITDPEMQKHINAATTKVESFNNFSDWISFGGRKLRTNDPVEMKKRVKYADLIANIVMLHNVIDLTRVLNEMNEEGVSITRDLLERLSPYITSHLRRFGKYDVDMEDVPEPLENMALEFL